MLGSLHSLIAYMLHSTIYQPVQQVPLLVSPRPPSFYIKWIHTPIKKVCSLLTIPS